jgi:hypothetical protein
VDVKTMAEPGSVQRIQEAQKYTDPDPKHCPFQEINASCCRAEWLVDVKTMADRIITMRHKLQQGLAKEGAPCQKSLSADYFLKVHLPHFSKIKSKKKVTKQ